MKELFERLENSEEFKKFKEEYPESYFCTAFLVLGTPQEAKTQLNYFISEKEVMSFDITPEKITPLKLKTLKQEKIPEIKKDEIKIDIEQAKKIIEDKEKKKFDKLIIVLQSIEGKPIWILTCMSGFSLHRVNVSAIDGKIHETQDVSLRDMIRVEKKNPKTGQSVKVDVQKHPEELLKKEPKKEQPKQEDKPDYVQ